LTFEKNRKWELTPGLVIAWHGIIIYHGGKAGERKSTMLLETYVSGFGMAQE